MQDEPFTSFPSPHLFYKSRSHIRAWKNLIYSIKKKEQVVMMAGEYGTGKTLLCLKMLRYMEKYKIHPRVHVPSSGFSFSMVLEKIAKELDLPFNPSNKEESQRFIYEYFETADPGRHKQIYIIIDDIQDFDYTFISELSKLITYNHYGVFPIRLYLFGHKTFFQNLDKRNLVSFKQRIRVIPLLPLNQEDVTEYIYFRLIASGASGSPVFEDPAVELITQTSGGLPRLINKMCDASLVIAWKLKINVIDRQVVEAALAEGGLVDFDEFREIPISSDPVAPEKQKKPAHETQHKSQFESRKIQPKRQPREPVPREPVPREPEPDYINAFQRSEHLFSDVPESEKAKKPRKVSGGKDLKKGAFLDGKTLTIIILIVILGLMVLFFIREVRLTNTQPPEINYHKSSSIVSEPVLFSETEQLQRHAVREKTSPPRSARWTDSVLRPVIHEFVEKSIELPLASNSKDSKMQQNIDSLTVYYDDKKWITSYE